MIYAVRKNNKAKNEPDKKLINRNKGSGPVKICIYKSIFPNQKPYVSLLNIGSEEIKGNFSYRLGTFNQHDVNIEVKQNVKEFKYTFFANRLSSSGYVLEPDKNGQTFNPFRNYSFNGKVLPVR